MKTFSRLFPVCACMVLLFGCGNDEQKIKIGLNGHAIVWAGFANADLNLKTDFDATVGCLKTNALPTRAGYAFVLVIDGPFTCNGVLTWGCAEINGDSIYMDKEYLYTSVFTHEVVHWETGMGNEYHNTPQFEACISYQGAQQASAENTSLTESCTTRREPRFPGMKSSYSLANCLFQFNTSGKGAYHGSSQ